MVDTSDISSLDGGGCSSNEVEAARANSESGNPVRIVEQEGGRSSWAEHRDMILRADEIGIILLVELIPGPVLLSVTDVDKRQPGNEGRMRNRQGRRIFSLAVDESIIHKFPVLFRTFVQLIIITSVRGMADVILAY